jgi:hypothetical protein
MRSLVLVTLAGLAVSACATQQQATGTAIGATTGAVVGGPVGAVVGAGVGAVAAAPGGVVDQAQGDTRRGTTRRVVRR